MVGSQVLYELGYITKSRITEFRVLYELVPKIHLIRLEQARRMYDMSTMTTDMASIEPRNATLISLDKKERYNTDLPQHGRKSTSGVGGEVCKKVRTRMQTKSGNSGLTKTEVEFHLAHNREDKWAIRCNSTHSQTQQVYEAPYTFGWHQPTVERWRQ